jgi:hypothetical protein
MAPRPPFFDVIVTMSNVDCIDASITGARHPGHPACRTVLAGQTGSMVGRVAPPVGFEQHAFDDAGIDVVGFEVFDGRHGIAAFLDRYAVIDDVTPARILPLVISYGDCLVTASRMLIFNHLRSSLLFKRQGTRVAYGVSDNKFQSQCQASIIPGIFLPCPALPTGTEHRHDRRAPRMGEHPLHA